MKQSPIKEVDRIKRELVSGAVDENVALMQGRLPFMLRQAKRRRGRIVTVSAFGLALAMGFASTLMLARSGSLRHTTVGKWLGFDEVPAIAAATESPQTPPQRVLPPIDETPVPRLEDLRLEQLPTIDRAVFPLGLERVILDPGHGGGNRGTASGNLVEKEITLDIAQRLASMLNQKGFEVLLTRTDDRDVELGDRAVFANDSRGDIFVSIHVNWLSTRAVRGVETFYLGTTEDPELNQLASAENRESGYSLADFRRLLEGIYVGVRQQESKSLASSVQRSLYRSLKVLNPNLRDRGVKTAPFVVLIGTEMPAILVEVAALSNEQEAQMLQDIAYRNYIAVALYDGLVRFADSLVLPQSPTATNSGAPAAVAKKGKD